MTCQESQVTCCSCRQVSPTCGHTHTFTDAVLSSSVHESMYRHKSLLSAISKVVESSIHKHLQRYLLHHDLILDEQYGCRPNHSTPSSSVLLQTSVALDIKDIRPGLVQWPLCKSRLQGNNWKIACLVTKRPSRKVHSCHAPSVHLYLRDPYLAHDYSPSS